MFVWAHIAGRLEVALSNLKLQRYGGRWMRRVRASLGDDFHFFFGSLDFKFLEILVKGTDIFFKKKNNLD